jgi:hypothetical protein
MRAEVLNSPPLSGMFPEVQFHASGFCTWVKFESGNADWVGTFGKGTYTHVNAACVFDADAHAFIIAGGQGYGIDLVGRSLLYRSRDELLTGAIAAPHSRFVVVSNETNLMVYDAIGEIWKSARIALDGIKFIDATRTSVHGFVMLGEWRAFVFNFDTRQVIVE